MSKTFARTRALACAALALLPALALQPAPGDAALAPAYRSLLQRYLGALQAGRYADAFALLSPDERRYFASALNYASVFAADRVKIERFTIVESKSDRLGTVALVSERVDFFDESRQAAGSATAKVAYGIVHAGGGLAIKDPYHPWRALAPADFASAKDGVKVIVRKLSFYTGRLEMVATFQNASDRPVTLLPYGRSTLLDQNGKAYAPIASRIAGLTDKTLYTGLRLPPSGQYTGLMTFLTPDRFSPTTLTLTIAPALFDGGDAPFALAFAPYPIPPPAGAR